MKFNESEKLQIAVAYATSKACNTPEDFISNVNNMLDELSPKNWYSIDTGLEPVSIDTDAILV